MVKAVIATAVGLGLFLSVLGAGFAGGLMLIEISPMSLEREAGMLGILIGGFIGYIPVALLGRAHRKGKLPNWLK